MKTLFALAMLCLASCEVAIASDVVSVVPRRLFVPSGFDDNDEVTAVLEGELPDTCFKLREPAVTVDKVRKVIEIDAQSYLGSGICHPLRVPYVTIAKIGVLPPGEYTVRATGIRYPERLEVRRATRETTDDHLYAPVDRTEVRMGSGGKFTAHLTGRLINTCLRIKKVDVEWTGRTLQLMPVAELRSQDDLGLPCRESDRVFEERVALPELPRGWYLLHVRTMNGQARNEVFTNEWPGCGSTGAERLVRGR